MDLILASNSPRRRELLSLAGLPFRVQAAEVDETPLDGEPAPAYVIRLAHAKAFAAARPLRDAAFSAERSDKFPLIIAADTTVSFRSRILGKPADAAEAVRLLRLLRGQRHFVFTALAMLTADDQMHQTICLTEVPMRRYSEAEIQAYVASGDPLDKAGAYAIQHTGFKPVASLQGCYANVVGLPLCHLVRLLRQVGIETDQPVAQACQEHLAYTCTVYPEILGDDHATLNREYNADKMYE